ncbi:hypothetical protein HYU89_02680 [Candidatus Collierbacteria bacterium]|nr:hypothetical protein [Candidatus Collierbacteria bacterium]
MTAKQDFKQIEKLLKDYPTRKELYKKLDDYPTREELYKKLDEYPKREELYKHLDLLGKALSEKIDNSLKDYPTKDELFKRLDHIVGELETIRTEQLILTHSQTEHESRYNHTPLQSITPVAS